jgi:S1-C subfamily serine protease
MATSSGSSGSGSRASRPGGRLAGKAAQVAKAAKAKTGNAPADPGQAAGPSDSFDSARSGLDALAARRVPKVVPPAPGGLLPTTRRGMFRYRVLPRSVIGVSVMILAFAIGAGFSGVVLFSYYQFRQNQANDKVNSLISGYKGQFAKAEADLNAAVAAARANIDNQLKNVQSQQISPTQIAGLVKQVAPSVYFVRTKDASGQPSVGTAFVISSNSSQSLLLTSYATVAAATVAPGPSVTVSQGDSSSSTPVTVKTWDKNYDLALLILPKGGLTPITAAPTSPAPTPGDRLFLVSGLGTAGASVIDGTVVDASSSGLLMDAPLGTPFQGGPIINLSGQVVAVGSRSYAPLNFTSDTTFFVPYVEAACAQVLSCPGGTLVGSH